MGSNVLLKRTTTERNSKRRVLFLEVCPGCGDDFDLRDGQWFKDPIDKMSYPVCSSCLGKWEVTSLTYSVPK